MNLKKYVCGINLLIRTLKTMNVTVEFLDEAGWLIARINNGHKPLRSIPTKTKTRLSQKS
jgi:hypothetical protein